MDRWITLVPCVPQLFGGPWLRAVASELLHHLDDLFGHGEAGVGRQVSSRGGFASANRSLPCAIGGALCGRGSAIHALRGFSCPRSWLLSNRSPGDGEERGRARLRRGRRARGRPRATRGQAAQAEIDCRRLDFDQHCAARKTLGRALPVAPDQPMSLKLDGSSSRIVRYCTAVFNVAPYSSQNLDWLNSITCRASMHVLPC